MDLSLSRRVQTNWLLSTQFLYDHMLRRRSSAQAGIARLIWSEEYENERDVQLYVTESRRRRQRVEFRRLGENGWEFGEEAAVNEAMARYVFVKTEQKSYLHKA